MAVLMAVAVVVSGLSTSPAFALRADPEFRINELVEGDQDAPSIASLAGGGFVAAWKEIAPSDYLTGVYARRFGVDDQPSGSDITVAGAPVPANSVGSPPALIADPGGGFTVAWAVSKVSFSSDLESKIMLRRFDASGQPLAAASVLLSTTTAMYSMVSLAADGAGGFVVVWSEVEPPMAFPAQSEVYARHFDSAGAPLSPEVHVNTTTTDTQTDPVVAADGSGGFTVAWLSGASGYFGSNFDVVARRFGSDGTPLTNEIVVNVPATTTAEPAIAADEDGNFTVAWVAGWSAGEIKARRFSTGGAPLGGEVSLSPAGAESPALLTDGQHLVAAWNTMFEGIAANWFDITGLAGGPALQIAAPVSGQTLLDPDVAFDGGSSFVVVWTRVASTGDIYARHVVNLIRTFINSGPVGATNDPEPIFTFSADEEASFECSLDGAPYSPCTSPSATGHLGDGPHTFSVRARDTEDHVDPQPPSRSFTVDTVAPQTQIDSGAPALGNDPSPTFAFSSNEAGVAFECRVDGGDYFKCSSPETVKGLSDGSHAFAVRAHDAAGNVDQTAATAAFAIDTVAPGTQIDTGPTGPISDPTPTFAFSSDDPGATFECRLNGGTFLSCASPFTTSPLPDGSHMLVVKARDAAGNYDPNPPAKTFVVDTAAPQVSIDSAPAAMSNDATPTFSFSASESGASFECRLDETAPLRCSSPHTTSQLSDGGHRFDVRAIDMAGNRGSWRTRRFTVDTRGPALKLFDGRWRPSTRSVEVKGGSDEDCTAEVTGRITRSRARHPIASLKIRPVQLQLNGERVLVLQLRPAQPRHLRRRARHERLDFLIRATCSDQAGNASGTELRFGASR